MNDLLDPDMALAFEVLDIENAMHPCGLEVSRDVYEKLQAQNPRAETSLSPLTFAANFRVYVRDDWKPGRWRYIYPKDRYEALAYPHKGPSDE